MTDLVALIALTAVCAVKSASFLFDFPVAEGQYADVVKLQTMRCLFEAYEHVLSLLENVFTPMFCHSDEVSISTKKLISMATNA